MSEATPPSERGGIRATPPADGSGAQWIPRPRCYHCHKPLVTCVCRHIPSVDNRTQVFVLQHPRETFHPIGTARFAELGLRHVRVERARLSEPAEAMPDGLDPNCALLYPAPDALPLEQVRRGCAPSCLVVLDGTWHHARTLYRDTPWLRRIPAYRLTPRVPSRYRIRREPAADCISTIEAIVAALQILEPETTHLAELIDAFEKMIDQQTSYLEHRSGEPRGKRRRAKECRALPRVLAEEFERLIVAYGESSLFRPAQVQREVLHWTAVRPSTGELFEQIVRPDDSLVRPWHLAHMNLQPADVANGSGLDELRERWARFTRPDDVVTAWNVSTLELLDRFVADARTVLLKGIYCNVHRGACGTLDDVVASHALRPEPLQLRGRAANRLANAMAISKALHELAV